MRACHQGCYVSPRVYHSGVRAESTIGSSIVLQTDSFSFQGLHLLLGAVRLPLTVSGGRGHLTWHQHPPLCLCSPAHQQTAVTCWHQLALLPIQHAGPGWVDIQGCSRPRFAPAMVAHSDQALVWGAKAEAFQELLVVQDQTAVEHCQHQQ